MKETKTTIKDVAEKAGVSTATVSMVISGKGKISEEKRKIVIDTINSLGYKRNRSGYHKEETHKNYIGLIAYCDYPFQWWFAKEFILEIKNRLMDKGIYTLMFHCDKQTDPQDLYDKVMAADISGVMALHYNDKEILSRLASQNMPLILVNNNNHQSDFHTSCADDYQGAYEGTRKMLEMGHKNILYIDFPRPLQQATVLDRLFGFRKAMEEAAMPFPDRHRVQVELNDHIGLKDKLSTLLKAEKDITAMFIHDDYLAIRVYKVLEDLGISIPEDMSILAPGDTLPYQELFIPPISTMQLNRSAMVEYAVKILLELLKNPDMPVQVVKTSERYVDRGSCIPVQ